MQHALAVLVALACVGRLGFLYLRLPAIWHGSTELPKVLVNVLFQVHPRSYLSYLVWDTAVLGAIAALALGLRPAAVVLALLAIPLAVLHLTVNFSGKPRLLIPPRQRGRPGYVAQFRETARRRAEGGPETDHVVEVYQVNSVPGEEQIERFMYAQCGQEGCEFLEFADPAAADEEASLRAKVAMHTTKQSPVIQIYV
jgi:hypothetical protein